MSSPRSTPRLRLTAVLLIALVGLVAVSDRGLATGLAGELVQLAGLACIACAALGRIWTSVFIAGRKDTSLVRAGPYSALRHPLYALSMLAMLGVGLATRSMAISVVLLAAFHLVYASAARAEDAFLAQVHGAGFEAFLDAASLVGPYLLLRLADYLQAAGITPTWLALP